MTTPKSILVVSNGFGEDQIARKLIDAMHQLNSNIRFITVPLVGPGTAYSGHPAIRNHPTPSLPPSGGFLRSFSDITRDLGAGLLKDPSTSRRYHPFASDILSNYHCRWGRLRPMDEPWCEANAEP